jgi:hypothetical protein
VTAAPDPGRHLLDKIDAREQALAREASDAQAQIGELTARLRVSCPAFSGQGILLLFTRLPAFPADRP